MKSFFRLILTFFLTQNFQSLYLRQYFKEISQGDERAAKLDRYGFRDKEMNSHLMGVI